MRAASSPWQMEGENEGIVISQPFFVVMNHAQKSSGEDSCLYPNTGGPGLARENGVIRFSAMNLKILLTGRKQNDIIIYVVGA